MKAYCVFKDFNLDACKIIENAGIELILNKSDEKPNGENLVSILKEYDIIILSVFCKLTKEMIKHINKPIIIATLSVGLDHIDKSFFNSPFVKIINIKTSNAISVAEHIFALILSLNKRVFESNKLVLEGKGIRSAIHQRPEDISGKVLGLIGCGNITQEVIKIANVFNMKLLCFTKNPSNHKDMINKGVTFVDLDYLLKESDIINISIPLNNETKNLISKEKISLMKPSATFINTSRSEVVDTNALIEYADVNKQFYVGLDIDVDKYNILKKYRENVIVTPHIAGITKQAVYRMDFEIANKIIDLVKNQV